MIRAIIVDDEQHCTDRLTLLLQKNHVADIDMMQSFSEVESALQGIRELQPDVLFLDIQIHDKTGFDLLQQITHRNFEVIFTTAFDNYAIQAFKCSAIDYLLKPVDAEDLAQAVLKLTKMQIASAQQRLSVLLHNMSQPHTNTKRISIPTVSGYTFIDANNILRCQSDINYTTLFLKDRQKITVAKTLKDFEEMLSPYNFFRVHNSHLVNLDCIKTYNKGKGGELVMTDNSIIEVSTRRKDELLRRLSVK